MGNYALHLELNDLVSVTGILAEEGAPTAIISVIASLPLGKALLSVFCVVSVIFMATTYNSSSYALASCASSKMKPGQQPARWHRLFWALAMIALPLTLMFIGDLKTGGFKSQAFNSLKTASLAVSLPSLAVFVIMAFSLVKSLKEHDNWVGRQSSSPSEPED